MKLIAGSYEKFIWGFSFSPSSPETLTTLFSYPSHTAPIKSVAAAGPVAASGAADDSIKIYDLASSAELGALLDPTAPVTALAFYAPAAVPLPRNLVAAAADGSVSIYDADPFVLLKTLAVHKRGVSDLAVHCSGRIALTVGRDRGLAIVNLVRGRRSFCCRLDEEKEVVRYEEGGERFFMAGDKKVSVHCSEDAKVVQEMVADRKVLCIAPGEGGLLYAGGEDRSVTAWDTTNGKVAYCINDAHSARVKGLTILKRSNSQTSEASNFLASASSDGVIRVWDVRMILKEKPNPLAEADTKSRLTCLSGSSTNCRRHFAKLCKFTRLVAVTICLGRFLQALFYGGDA